MHNATLHGILASSPAVMYLWVDLETIQSMKSKLPTQMEIGGSSIMTQLEAAGSSALPMNGLFQVSL